MHPAAAAGFGSDGDRYERARPGYPSEAIAAILSRFPVNQDSVVVDLAAGTGKLTRLLRPYSNRVIAIEPVPAMAATCRAQLPQLSIIAAIAEAIPLGPSTVDLVTIGQAFHWFRPDETWVQLERIVKPGGGVAAIWNARDNSAPWLAEIWSLMDAAENNAPWRNHDQSSLAGFEYGSGFGSVERHRFSQSLETSVEQTVERFASISYFSVLSPTEQNTTLGKVRSIARAAEHELGALHVTYGVDLYLRQRL